MSVPNKAQRFNDASLLGQSITLLPKGLDAFSLSAVKGSKRRIFKLSEEYVDITFPGGLEYSIPANTNLVSGTGKTTTKTIRVETGQELANNFDTDASLSASYAGVTASVFAQYSYHSSLSASKYYAIVSVDHDSFQIEAAMAMPDWSRDPAIYRKYMEFCQTWGTYIMRPCSFGARYQLRVERESSKEENLESFEAHVKTEYNGAATVKDDASVKKTQAYKTYLERRQSQCLVYGGDSASAVILSNAPDIDSLAYQKAFENWAKSLNNVTSTNLVNVQIDSIGNLLKNSHISEHRQVAPRFISALKYIAEMRVLKGTIECTASGLVRSPAYECYIDAEPGMELVFQGAISKNIHARSSGPAHLLLTLDNYGEAVALHGAVGKVQVTVTSPVEPSMVHFRKPGDEGYRGCVLNLTPVGPTVQSTAADKKPNTSLDINNSLCEPGTYGT